MVDTQICEDQRVSKASDRLKSYNLIYFNFNIHHFNLIIPQFMTFSL
jgi:hypothetical protein